MQTILNSKYEGSDLNQGLQEHFKHMTEEKNRKFLPG